MLLSLDVIITHHQGPLMTHGSMRAAGWAARWAPPTHVAAASLLLACALSCLCVCARPIPHHGSGREDHWDVQSHFAKFAAQPSTCPGGYGREFLEGVKKTQAPYCADGPSSIMCATYPDGGGHVCDLRDVQLDMAALYTALRQPEGSTPKPAPITAACKLREHVQPRGLFVQEGSAPLQCSHNVTHPVLLLKRYDATNSYHHLEYITDVFVQVMTWPLVEQRNVEVVIIDDMAPGFYLEIWRRLNLPHVLRFASQRPYPPGTCFRQVALPSTIRRSIIHLTFFNPPTCQSPLFHAILSWLRSTMYNIRPEAYNWPLGQFLQALHGMHGQLANTTTPTTKRVVCKVSWISRR